MLGRRGGFHSRCVRFVITRRVKRVCSTRRVYGVLALSPPTFGWAVLQSASILALDLVDATLVVRPFRILHADTVDRRASGGATAIRLLRSAIGLRRKQKHAIVRRLHGASVRFRREALSFGFGIRERAARERQHDGERQHDRFHVTLPVVVGRSTARGSKWAARTRKHANADARTARRYDGARAPPWSSPARAH